MAKVMLAFIFLASSSLCCTIARIVIAKPTIIVVVTCIAILTQASSYDRYKHLCYVYGAALLRQLVTLLERFHGFRIFGLSTADLYRL